MSIKKLSRKRTAFLGIVLFGLTSAFRAVAQLEDRPSVVGGRLERQYTFETQDYNVKVGPVTFKATADLRTDFNDNINLAEHNPVSDFIMTPSLNISALWPVTPFNALRLTTSIGYQAYLEHPQYDRNATAFTIAPDSALDYDIYIGHFTLNLHDRFSILQNPVNEPTLSNVVQYGAFVNTVGATLFWDVNKDVILTTSYDHTDNIPTTSTFDFSGYDEDQISASARFAVASHVAAGLEGSVASTRYTTGEKADAKQLSVGPFVDWNLSEYTRLRVGGGYQAMSFDGSTTRNTEFAPGTTATTEPTVVSGTAAVSNQASPYFNVALVNRLSQHFTQTLSAGHELSLDITAASLSLYYVRYIASWEVNSAFTINANCFYNEGHQQGADLPEHFDQIGFGLSTSYRLSRKLTATLGYQFIHKNSDVQLNSYYQNVISLGLEYNF